jgi:hypothetical protein
MEGELMNRSDSTPSPAKLLTEAYARRDDLLQSLLTMNGGNPNLYANIGSNEGYDSLLCALRGEEAVIEELRRGQEAAAKE